MWHFRIILAALLALFVAQPLLAPTGLAHDGEQHEKEETQKAVDAIVGDRDTASEEKARKYFTDNPVVTQDGETLKFYSDVLKDRIVVVNLFYTECKGSCPLNNQKLSHVQDLLGERFGSDYIFVSVSLDPKTDTQEKIKKYADSFGARDGWLFLTGDEKSLRQITQRLGQVNDDIAAHSPFFMIGNVPKAHWTRVPPNAPPQAIVAKLELMSGQLP